MEKITLIDKTNGNVLYAPIPPNPLCGKCAFEEYWKRIDYILENGVLEYEYDTKFNDLRAKDS